MSQDPKYTNPRTGSEAEARIEASLRLVSEARIDARLRPDSGSQNINIIKALPRLIEGPDFRKTLLIEGPVYTTPVHHLPTTPGTPPRYPALPGTLQHRRHTTRIMSWGSLF